MGGRTARVVLVQLGLVVLALALVGVVAGVVWQWVCTPVSGIVVDHRWVPLDVTALQQEFSATGWYVVVGSAAGLVSGALVALLVDRMPLLTLVALLAGSALGAWLMLLVGTALGPSDPTALARHAADGTRLAHQLEVAHGSPWGALPAGALVGLIAVFLGLSPHRRPVVTEPR